MTDNLVSRVITATSLFLVRGGKVMILPAVSQSKISTTSPGKEEQEKEVGLEMKGGQEKQEEDRPSRERRRASHWVARFNSEEESKGRMLIVRLSPTFPLPILSPHSVLCCGLCLLPRTLDLGPGLWTLADQVHWTLGLSPGTWFQGVEV